MNKIIRFLLNFKTFGRHNHDANVFDAEIFFKIDSFFFSGFTVWIYEPIWSRNQRARIWQKWLKKKSKRNLIDDILMIFRSKPQSLRRFRPFVEKFVKDLVDFVHSTFRRF